MAEFKETCSDISVKREIASTLTKAMKDLYIHDTFLGWSFDEESVLNGEKPGFKPTSFISALWYYCIHHSGYEISLCLRCGNTFLSRTQGTRNKYCTDSCRVQAAKKRTKTS